MTLGSRVSLAVELLAILAVLALVGGQPVLLSCTTSESTEPTVGTGIGCTTTVRRRTRRAPGH